MFEFYRSLKDTNETGQGRILWMGGSKSWNSPFFTIYSLNLDIWLPLNSMFSQGLHLKADRHEITQ